jgi:ribose-phosphate pyrophosphokinase
MFIVTSGNRWLQYKAFVFSGGEVSVKLTPELTSFTFPSDVVHITAHITSSNKVMELVMLTDAIRREWGDVAIVLKCPYLPYARQDRVCAPGESLSLKVFCDIINSLKFRYVYVADVHSEVALALLDNVVNIQQENFVSKIDSKYLVNTCLVSPDAGATKKINNVARALKLPVIRADKVRDPNTGEITGTDIQKNPAFWDSNLLVVDDICDGGRTFIELAKKAKERYEIGKYYLYVTHGIFSKGLEPLLEYYDHIFTAYPFPGIAHEKLTVLGGI